LAESDVAEEKIAIRVAGCAGNSRPVLPRRQLQFGDAQSARRPRIQLKIKILEDQIPRFIANCYVQSFDPHSLQEDSRKRSPFFWRRRRSDRRLRLDDEMRVADLDQLNQVRLITEQRK